MKQRRYKTKHRRGLTLGSLTWVGHDKEFLLGMVKNLIDTNSDETPNTSPNKEEEANR